jgi:hypothetical protein
VRREAAGWDAAAAPAGTRGTPGGAAGAQTLGPGRDLTLPLHPLLCFIADPPATGNARGSCPSLASFGWESRGRRSGSPAGPSGNMATGGYRTSGGLSGSTTDFLEEWKAKREKMRAKQNPPGPTAPAGGSSDSSGKPPVGAPGTSAPAEVNNNVPGGPAAPAAPGPGGVNCAVGPAALPRAAPGSRRPEDESPVAAAAASASGIPAPRGDEEEPDGPPEKGRSSGPSARKGKGQIEKRKLREKRRSTGVVNIPAAEVSGRAGSGRRLGSPTRLPPRVPCCLPLIQAGRVFL